VVERTLALVKPDAMGAGLEEEIVARIEREGFRVVATRRERLSRVEAMAFYEVHEGKSFFDSLVAFMSSGPIVALLLEKENAIRDLRDVIGATDPKEARKGTIRAQYASSKERNAVHASDSPESAKTEIPFFFSILEALRSG
jgi:nucleoside-diphosphate kinase